MVVVRSPGFDNLPCLVQISEPVLVQAKISELAIEALYEGILRRLARLNEMQFYADLLGPKEHGLGGEFRTVVADNRLGQLP